MGKQRESSKRRTESRRDFLKGMLVGSAGAVLVAASREAPAAPAEQAVAEPAQQPAAGYRETDHVRAYYDTAGL